MKLKNIKAAIRNYEKRLEGMLEDAANPDTMPSPTFISGCKNDLQALYSLLRDEEQMERVRKIAAEA